MSRETNKKAHFIFFPLDPNRTNPTSRRLLCPHCHKLLHRSDIEEFRKCPFCEYSFPENDPVLEDFYLDPLTEEWAKEQLSLLQAPVIDQSNDSFFS